MTSHEPTRVAAIDLGTNTALLLIAQVGESGELEVVEDHSRTCRLGEGVARTGKLSPAAIERTLATLAEFRGRVAARGIPRDALRAVGTAVLRRAADADAFRARVGAELGFELEVLAEEDEARLGHLAVTADGGAQETLVIDVGGGSTELVGDLGRLRLSAPIGAVVLTETYLGSEAAPAFEPGGWPALRAAVAHACERFPVGIARDAEVVLLGGTAVNLACLDLGLPRFDHARAEGHRLQASAAARFANQLAALPLDERLALPIEPDRAPILPAGLACLAGALERIGAPRARISTRGLRYGLARELLTSRIA